MKSIEELARELVDKISRCGPETPPWVMRHWPEYKALKSALARLVEKADKFPQWFTWGDEFLLFYTSQEKGMWHQLSTGFSWETTTTIAENRAGSEDAPDYMRPITEAEALAIIEKAKIK